MNKEQRRLPTGEITTDVELYVNSWREFAKPLEKVTGMKLYGYDPGIHLTKGYGNLNLPTWFVTQINSVLSALTNACEGAIPCLEDWMKSTGFGEVHRRDEKAWASIKLAISIFKEK